MNIPIFVTLWYMVYPISLPSAGLVSHLFVDLMTFPGFGHTLPKVAKAILWIRPGQESEKSQFEMGAETFICIPLLKFNFPSDDDRHELNY